MRPPESFLPKGGEGALDWGDAGGRREVPFVAFSQLGKFLEGGEFLQVLDGTENKLRLGLPPFGRPAALD